MQDFAYTTAITELIEIKIIHVESSLTLLTSVEIAIEPTSSDKRHIHHSFITLVYFDV